MVLESRTRLNKVKNTYVKRTTKHILTLQRQLVQDLTQVNKLVQDPAHVLVTFSLF
jgi:hypothetical protein